ncbi:MAG: DUF1800 domain-containing protein [Bacteroidia bacterium]|nr:DUF1800 domain-containing protein [Bacteroidia bacterium]
MASITPRTGKLGKRHAAHLLRRTSFQVTRKRIDQFAGFTVEDALKRLLVRPNAPAVPEPIDPNTGKAWLSNNQKLETGDYLLRRYVTSWWLHEAQRDHSISHKMMFFLHTNFSTAANSGSSLNLFDHLNLLRFYALGSIKKLSVKITLDALMLKYLGNHRSHKRHPNENYAREFLELFTIGKGPQKGSGDYTHYTETDVIQAARLLTGYRLYEKRDLTDPETKLPRTSYFDPKAHDTEDKKFSRAFQNSVISGGQDEKGMQRELDDFVNMVFNQEATAKHICRKLYRFL